jgi:tripartite-type tricarboxylate transporter receptor subunit TctC
MYEKKVCCWLGLFLLLTIVAAGWAGEARSQEKYPSRAIDIIVPFAPGGSTDMTARVVSAYLKKKWGVPVNVVNKPGGNTVPASLEVYTAKPDGYTLLLDGTPSCSMLPAVVKNIPFELMDRTFFASIGICPFIFSVYPGSAFKSMKDVEAEAKKDPENFTWTSLGGAALQDFSFRQFLKAIGVDVTKTKPVMSQGGSQAMVLTAGGNVKVGGGAVPSSLPAISGKTIRPLAITGKNRWPDLPDLLTAVEQGFPTVTASEYKSIAGPPKTPSYIIEIWEKAFKEMANDPEAIAQLRKVGMLPFYRDSKDIKEYTINEMKEVKELWGLK